MRTSSSVLLILPLILGGGCDREAESDDPVADSAPSAPAETGSNETPVEPMVAIPSAAMDAAAEAVDIEAVTPGVYWIRKSAGIELMYAIAADAWTFDRTDEGVVIHVAGSPRLATRVGLGEGDVLKRVGPIDLTGPFEPRDVYDLLMSSDPVLVELQRDGALRRQVYRVRDGRVESSVSQRKVREDILALAVQSDPWRVERAVFTAIGKASESTARSLTDALVERIGLPAEASEWTVDGQSVTQVDLPGVLAQKADATKVALGAEGVSVELQVVTSTIDAGDLASTRSRTDSRRRGIRGLLESDSDPGDGLDDPDPEVTPATEDWADASRADESDAVEYIADGHFRFSRKALDDLLANPAAAAKSCRIVPSVRDGETRGFKLYGIRRETREGALPMYALGFKNGDMITAINGNELTAMDQALDAYTKVRDADKLEITVERRGKRHEVVIELTK